MADVSAQNPPGRFSYLPEIIEKSSNALLEESLEPFTRLGLNATCIAAIRRELLRQVQQVVLPTLLLKARLLEQECVRRIPPKSLVASTFASDAPLDILAHLRVRMRARYIADVLQRVEERLSSLSPHLPLYTLRDSGEVGAEGVLSRALKSIHFTDGETHQGARSPVLIQLDHTCEYFKPTSGSLYTCIHDVLALCLPEYAGLIPSVVYTEPYGHFSTQILHSDAQNLEQYDLAFGVLSAVAWILRISDLHFENVIAAAHGPVMIDLEVMAHAYGDEHQLDWTGLFGDTALSAYQGGGTLWKLSPDARLADERLEYQTSMEHYQNRPSESLVKSSARTRCARLEEGFRMGAQRLLSNRPRLLELLNQALAFARCLRHTSSPHARPPRASCWHRACALPMTGVFMSSRTECAAAEPSAAEGLEPGLVQPSILFEGAEWLVVDKPPGWHSVRHTLSHGGPTVEEWLLATRPEQAQLPEAGLVHRLDYATRGCLVAARDRIVYAWLRDAFSKEDDRVQKTYRALTEPGIPEQGDFCLYFFSRYKGSARMSVREAGDSREVGRCCWRVLKRSAEEALVEVRLLGPGRRHQIRAGLAHLGYPLLGDTLYGGPPDGRFPLGAALAAVEVQVLNQKVSLKLEAGEAFAG